MIKISLLANDLSALPSALKAIEIFNIANILWNQYHPGSPPVFSYEIVSPAYNSKGMTDSFCEGLEVKFSKGLTPFEKTDVALCTGFLYRDLAELEDKTSRSTESIKWLQRQYANGAIIGVNCGGTVLLAETGILNGVVATTSWYLNDFFRVKYPEIKLNTDMLLIEHERILTAGPASSTLNLSLAIIKKVADSQLALACSKIMIIDINKESQSQYSMLQPVLSHSDNLITRAQFYMNENFHKKIDMAGVADKFSVSYRTFARRFVSATGDTPVKFLQKIRIEAAKNLLETSDLNIDVIMQKVGYSDHSSFNQLFKKLTSLTPVAFRKKFLTLSSSNLSFNIQPQDKMNEKA